jgi:hypothetical protein
MTARPREAAKTLGKGDQRYANALAISPIRSAKLHKSYISRSATSRVGRDPVDIRNG